MATGKRGNPNMRKGGPSVNPRGKGVGRDKIQKDVVFGLHHALKTAHPDGVKGYFLDIARNDKALFVGMLSKVMPNETAVSVTVDLGDAMIEAQKRLDKFEAIESRQMTTVKPVIDMTPMKDEK